MQEKHPVKKLNLVMVTALVTGNMIGSGVFLLPASLAQIGTISIFGWIITSLGALALASLFAALAQKLPKAGGPYVYCHDSLGEFIGFLIAWGYWVGLCVGNAALAVAAVGYFEFFLPALSQHLGLQAISAIAIVWFFTAINCYSYYSSGIVQLLTTICKLLPLALIIVLGCMHFSGTNWQHMNVSNSSTFHAIITATSLTLWSFLGLESATIPTVAIINPAKTIPRATIFGTTLAALVYIGSFIAIMSLLPVKQLATSTAPFSDAASYVMGPYGGWIMSIGAIISCLGALNGWTLLQGQVPFAIAKDKLLPPFFGRVNSNKIPVNGLVFSSIFITLLIMSRMHTAVVPMFTFMILLATLSILFPYIFSTIAQIVLLKRAKSYKTSHLWVAIGAFCYSFLAIAGAGVESVYWGVILLLAGLPLYAYMKWQQPDKYSHLDN